MKTRKTVLVTGASSGFGRLTVQKFHAEGWNVVATMRSPGAGSKLGDLDNVLVTRLDVTDRDTIDSAVREAVAEFGTIDVLVNNAGYGTRGFLEEASEQEMVAQFDTNVFGVIRTIQAVTPVMRSGGGGCIINVTSISGLFGSYLDSLYAASKAAVQLLSESLSYELSVFDIAVKVVAPGGFGTDFLDNLSELTGNHVDALDQHKATFRRYLEASAAQNQSSGKAPADAMDVADKIFACATTDTPLNNLVGADALALEAAKASQSEAEFMSLVQSMTMPPEYHSDPPD